jgi:hypothetical protein
LVGEALRFLSGIAKGIVLRLVHRILRGLTSGPDVWSKSAVKRLFRHNRPLARRCVKHHANVRCTEGIPIAEGVKNRSLRLSDGGS